MSLAIVFAGSAAASATPALVAVTTSCATTPTVAPPVVAASGNPAGLYADAALTGSQVDAAATIVNVGLDAGITRRGIKIALIAAMAASSLNAQARNHSHLGLFQQAVDRSSGLYTAGDRLDPVATARMFFEQLSKRVPGYDTDPRPDTELADVVQESGDAGLLASWDGLAEALTAKFIPVVEAPVADPATIEPVVATPTVDWNSARMRPALRAAGVALAAAPTDPGTSTADGAVSTPSDTSKLAGTGVSTDVTTSATATTAGADDASTTSAVDSTTQTQSGTDPGSAEPTQAGTEPTGSASPVTDSSATDPATTGTDPTSTGSTAPGTIDPSSSEPTSTDPTTTHSTDPGTGVPTSTDPGTGDPTSTDPGTTDPSTVPTAPATDPAVVTPAPEPTNAPDPAVVDTPAVVPSTDSDPSVGPDTVTTPHRSAVIDCAPNNNGGSTTFDPGFIISDEVFYNSTAMTADQIQTFLAQQGAACEGVWCVKNLHVTSSDIAADQYCNAYTGGTDELASAVIAKVSVACGINPQVMLVTLQKESALLTRSSVSAASYNAAWGWHCPDTGPGGSANCDPKYAGFFNQAFGMAKQWSRYRVDPDKYNYKAGQTATILWNVAQSGCGGTTVQIKNTATASLYDYTPYTPNAAALASYPGVGDRCSAYGNRNFFYLFQKYFGVTGGGLSAAIAVNGVQVTIPDSPYVAAAVRGATITAPNEAVARGIAAGFAAVGEPYVWGGGTNGGQEDQGCSRGGGSKNSCAGIVGFDCSGLTAYILTQAGFAIGTNSGSQRAGGLSVDWSAGQPGDIVGYSGHVALYLGKINGVEYLLEAPDVGKFVQIRPVYYRNGGKSADSVLHRYWL